jgi:AMMECR1 domain-containing protein
MINSARFFSHTYTPSLLSDRLTGPGPTFHFFFFFSFWWTSPLFVTWNTRTHARRSSGGGDGGGAGAGGWNTRLRGCIGTFDAQPLRAGLGEYALLSAFRDHRFRRVELRELPSLECGCVILSPYLSLP